MFWAFLRRFSTKTVEKERKDAKGYYLYRNIYGITRVNQNYVDIISERIRSMAVLLFNLRGYRRLLL